MEQQQGQSTLSRSSYTVATLEVPLNVFDLIAKKLQDAGYGHAFMAEKMMDLSGVALVPDEDAEPWHLSKDNLVAVGRYPFLPVTKDTPRGVKVLLLGPGRTATLASYDGDPQWTHWFPMPYVPEDAVDPYWVSKQEHEKKAQTG